MLHETRSCDLPRPTDVSGRSRSTGHRRTDRPRPRTCYHEAGHCLVRWYFGHGIEGVEVLTPAQVGVEAWPTDRRGRRHPCEGIVEGYEICGLERLPEPSGGNEELLRRHRRGKEINAEVALIEDFAGIAAEARHTRSSWFACGLDGGAADLAHARDVLECWFPDSGERGAAERLAERRATALVRSEPGWRAITAIAEALMMSGRLDGREVNGLCEQAFGRQTPRLGVWRQQWPPSLAVLRAGRIPE